jgi:hypothetical protein
MPETIPLASDDAELPLHGFQGTPAEWTADRPADGATLFREVEP